MEVILLEKIESLGGLGDKVKVRSGYGRNFLIPTGRAVPATEANLKVFEERRAELEAQAQEKMATATARKEKIEALESGITVVHRAGEEGKLFGSVGTAEIAEAATIAGVEIAKSEVRLPTGAIRIAGDYEITIHLHPEVDASLLLHVVREE
jgi:large subunit ribosomal protein L9